MGAKKSEIKSNDKEKVKAKPKKKVKARAPKYIYTEQDFCIDIMAKIQEICKRNNDISVIMMDDTNALMVKKDPVTVKSINNNNPMQPYEKEYNKTFFHLFALWWVKKPHGRLVDMGIPMYEITDVEGVSYVIKDA